ncbi:MAG: YIP1 family protein [Acidobacteriota bacterium]|nr:YIP1 family protein [Acidobacteriota bacterium]
MRAAKTIVKAAAQPGRTLRALAAEPGGLASGAKTLLAAGGLYALISVGLAAAGALPPVPPLLILSPENYYLLQALFVLPVLFLAWLAAGGTAFILSRRRGQGSFEGLLAALAPAMAVPLTVIGLAAAALAVFLATGGRQKDLMDLTAWPGIEQAIAFGLPLLAAAWMIVLFIVAVRSARRIGRIRAAAIGLTTGCVALGFFLVFIR